MLSALRVLHLGICLIQYMGCVNQYMGEVDQWTGGLMILISCGSMLYYHSTLSLGYSCHGDGPIA